MAYIGNAPADRFTSIPTVQQFNGDGSTTAFTLSRPVGTDQDLLVSVDGVIQDTAAYAVSNGTTLTFSAAPSTGTANIFVNYLGVTIGSVVHPASSALAATTGTFNGALSATTATLSGALSVAMSNDPAQITVKQNGNTNGFIIKNFDGDEVQLVNVDNGPMVFKTNDTERMRIHSSGVVSVPVGIELGSGVDATAANTLDDYEEGTWDGTLVTGGGSITVDTGSNQCWYTKIGGLVTVGGRLEVGSVSSPSGHLQIGGIPFNTLDTGETSALNAVTIIIYSPAANPTGVFIAEMDDNRTHILIRDGGGHTGGALTCADHIDAGSNVAFTATYRAT